jgi:peptide/nickel transport system substrate-binding protein
MQHKIVGIVVCLLITIGSFPLTADMISLNIENHISIDDVKIQEVAEQNYLTSQQNVLIFGCAGDADKLDPGDTTDGESIARTDNIFEGLVDYVPGTADIQPCLATSWDISPDGKLFTFYLRQGVKFHDGTDFNADAVVFSFERQYNTSHPYHQYGVWEYWDVMFRDVKKIEKIDTYTVNIELKQPNAGIMKSLAMFTAMIVSPTNAGIWKEDAFKHPVGTGPFKFVEWVMDDHITLEANGEYWRGKPKIETLIFKVIQDPSARLLALQTNTIQGMADPDQASFDTIKADKNLTIFKQTDMNLAYMAINNGYGYYDTNQNSVHDPDEPWVKTPGYFEPFTNKLVRQAINYAINKTAIIENIYGGTAIVAKTGIPPSMLGYNDDIADYLYEPDKARALLTEAGYPNGFNTTLWVMPVSRLYIDDPLKIAEAFQSYLEDVNIHVEIYMTDWSTYLQKTAAGEHPMCFLGWISDNGDPDNFMNPLYGANQCIIGSASNVAFYNNTKVQDLLSAAVQTYDNNERARLYKEAQVIIHEDAPFVYLAHVNQYVVFRSNVTGFIMNPTGRLFFYPVEFETIPDEPDGRILFTARSTGPCGIGWGYGLRNESDHTPDAYFEPGKGIIINFGTVLYHSLYSPSLTNYFIKDGDGEALWNVKEKTLMSIDWQHEGVKHYLKVTCTPLEETTSTFSTTQKAYLICPPPSFIPPDHESNCMAFTGIHKNGSKTESISGYAVLLAVAEENSSSMFPQPIIMIWLFQNKDEGKSESLLIAEWAKNGIDDPDIIVERAKTFHVNFWML